MKNGISPCVARVRVIASPDIDDVVRPRDVECEVAAVARV